MKFLREKATMVFNFILVFVLIGKVSSRFLDFSDETNQLLNTAMFSLIGIAYLAFSWAFEKIILKIILLFSGLYLILMNFLPDSEWNSIIGIFCTATILFLADFFQKKNKKLLLHK
ncbi:MAG: hypothetical protein ACK4SF_03555 [Algoriphagus aquaeductus]|uniref:hypothetical protein n=1 Tax=Algoriphagus aquaeductus TaxID=475299 RepID=UPI00391C1C73